MSQSWVLSPFLSAIGFSFVKIWSCEKSWICSYQPQTSIFSWTTSSPSPLPSSSSSSSSSSPGRRRFTRRNSLWTHSQTALTRTSWESCWLIRLEINADRKAKTNKNKSTTTNKNTITNTNKNTSTKANTNTSAKSNKSGRPKLWSAWLWLPLRNASCSRGGQDEERHLWCLWCHLSG